MDTVKELVFLVGACVIMRSDVKNGNTDIDKKKKSTAINMFDTSIDTAIKLLRYGFSNAPEDEAVKKEILESLFEMSKDLEQTIKKSHFELAKQNALQAEDL